MNFKYLDRITFREDVLIKDILRRFNETADLTEKSGFAIIVNSSGVCVGVVSDGDIRRTLLKEKTLDDRVKTALNPNFIFVNKNDSSHKVLRQFDKKIRNLPVLDQGIPIDLYQYSKFLAPEISKKRIIRSRVPVRVSYSGGGTDMSSYINEKSTAVLSSTINKYCTASIIVREDSQIHIKSKDLGLKYFADDINQLRYGDELDLIKASIKVMRPSFGFELETFAEFDPGTGLGGSSAVVVSVLGALNYFRNDQQLDLYQLADLAYQVERIDMNMEGGWQDQYSITFGGFSWIEFEKDQVIVNPLKLNRDTQLELEYNLMLFRLIGNRSSSKIQEQHKKTMNKKNMLFKNMLELAKKMKIALLKGEVKKFADMLHDSWMIKKNFNSNISNNFVEECYETARSLGALGGKLLGAGETGYLLIYSSPIFQKKIKNSLAKKGAIYESFKFSNNGLEVWSTKR